MTRSWIHFTRGRFVRQARVGLGELREEHLSRQGFAGPVAMLYRTDGRIHTMRGGVVAKSDYPRFRGKPISAIPGFSFPSSWWLARPFRGSGSEDVVEAPPTAWEVNVDGTPCGIDRSPVLEPQQFRQGQVQESKRSTRTRPLAQACGGRTTLAATLASAASASSGRRAEG